MVVVIVVIVLVAGVGVYFAVARSASNTTISSATTSATSPSSASASTTPPSIVTTTKTRSTATVSSGITTYSGTFNFSLPLGPSGERVLSNNTIQTYGSTQVGSGTFSFSINSQTYEGTGSGQGTLIVTTTGFCSGKVSFPYTFQIPDATNILGGNITVFFGDPTPENAIVPLACTGPMAGVNTATNNPVSFLAVYPNEINTVSIPVTVNQHETGNISYYYEITQTS